MLARAKPEPRRAQAESRLGRPLKSGRPTAREARGSGLDAAEHGATMGETERAFSFGTMGERAVERARAVECAWEGAGAGGSASPRLNHHVICDE